MNKSMIAYILGWIMKLEGLFMLIPVLVALIYREHNGVWFAIVAVCALVFGAVVTHKKPESNVFYMRGGLYRHGNELVYHECDRLSAIFPEWGNSVFYRCIV